MGEGKRALYTALRLSSLLIWSEQTDRSLAMIRSLLYCCCLDRTGINEIFKRPIASDGGELCYTSDAEDPRFACGHAIELNTEELGQGPWDRVTCVLKRGLRVRGGFSYLRSYSANDYCKDRSQLCTVLSGGL